MGTTLNWQKALPLGVRKRTESTLGPVIRFCTTEETVEEEDEDDGAADPKEERDLSAIVPASSISAEECALCMIADVLRGARAPFDFARTSNPSLKRIEGYSDKLGIFMPTESADGAEERDKESILTSLFEPRGGRMKAGSRSASSFRGSSGSGTKRSKSSW